jgi:hypothetical protein
LVFGLALVTRLAFQIGVVGMNAPPHDDAALYDSVAQSVSQGGPYVDSEGYRSRRPPGFPLLLAGLYSITGHDWRAARALQAVIGALTCVLVLVLGSSWFGIRTGLPAALACAVFPYTVYWSAHLLTEPLAALLTTASTLALTRAGADHRATAAWAITCALAALTRPNLGLLFVLGLVWVLWRSGRRAATLLIACGVFCLVLLPWMVRGYVVHHQLVPITSAGGVVLWFGNNPIVMATPALRGRALTGEYWRDDPALALPEMEQSRVFGLRAMQFIREHARDMPALVLAKLARLWNPFPTLESAWSSRLASLTWIPILVCFVAGVVRAWIHRDPRIWPPLVPVLAVTITAAVYCADARFRAPADPAIVLVASYGFMGWLEGRRAPA